MGTIEESSLGAKSSTDAIRASYNQEMLMRDPRTLFHYYIRLVHEHDARNITRDQVMLLIGDTYRYPVVGYNSDLEVIVVLALEIQIPRVTQNQDSNISDERWDRFVRVLKKQALFYHTD